MGKISKLLLFGPPGAGKGTQAAIISEALGIPHIDTGSIIRENITNESPLGLEAKAFVEKGKLIPDELVIELIRDRIQKSDCAEGWLLDGFPRALKQAEALSEMGPDKDEIVQKVVFIDVPEDELVGRLTSRRICQTCKAVYNLNSLPPVKDGVCDKCGSELIQRADDNEESVRTRFRVYREETSPIAGYYRDKKLLVDVSGDGGVQAVTDRILDVLKENNPGGGCCCSN